MRRRVVRPLQTLSNLLAALREGDFSIRARGARRGDPLGEVLVEVNALAETLRQQRLGALEATALLRKVMEEIDVAVFTFDEDATLQLTSTAPASASWRSRWSDWSAAAPRSSGSPSAWRASRRAPETAFPGASGAWRCAAATSARAARRPSCSCSPT